MRCLTICLLAIATSACGGSETTQDVGESGPQKTLQDAGEGRTTEGEGGDAESEAGPPGGQPEEEPAAKEDEAAARRRAQAAAIAERLPRLDDDFDRAEALAEAIELGPDAEVLWPPARKGLESDEEILREVSLRLAVAIRGAGARSLLKEGLADPSPAVRRQAAEGWTKAGFSDTRPLFSQLEAELDPGAQEALVAAIAAANRPADLERLSESFTILEEPALLGAVAHIQEHGDEELVPEVRSLLNREGAAVRAAAVEALVELGDRSKATAKALVRALEDDDVRVRRAAFEALKGMAGSAYGYDPDAPEAARQQALPAWRKWAERQS